MKKTLLGVIGKLERAICLSCSFESNIYSKSISVYSTVASKSFPKIYENPSHELTSSQREDNITKEAKKKFGIISDRSNDHLLSKLMLKVKSKKNREKSDLIVVEGKRIINEATSVGLIPEVLFFSRKSDLEKLSLPNDQIKLVKVHYKEIQLWSDLVTSPGIIAFYKKPALNYVPKDDPKVTVICDQVKEPGNLGSIIRASAAAGVSQLILTKGCTDAWDPKVLRGASGAHFRIPIKFSETWPINNDVPASLFLADNNDLAICNNKNIVQYDLPILPYYSVDYSNLDNIFVIIGGETDGLSNEAYEYASSSQGVRVIIPLSNNVESLNNASAICVILFEINRQKAMVSRNFRKTSEMMS